MGSLPDFAAMAAAAGALAADWAAPDPGGAILGFDAGGVRFAVSAGCADLAQGSQFRPETPIRLASLTKHFLACHVLLASDRIELQDALGRHLPELPPALAAVTVAQALSMTGGLPDLREHLALLGLPQNAHCGLEAAHHQLAALTTLNSPAGSELSYSNSGYRLVETALARHAGPGRPDFADFVAQDIRKGLGLAIHAPELWGDTVPGLVPGYWAGPNGWHPGEQGLPLSASGRLVASAEALAGWLVALLAGTGPLAGLLPRLAEPGRMADGRTSDYGLGLYRLAMDGRLFLGHGGSLPGYKSAFLIDRDTGAGVVITANREDVAASTLARRVLAAGFGLAGPAPVVAGWAAAGHYRNAAGTRWVEVKAQSLVHMGAEEPLFQGGNGEAVSLSPAAPIRLRPVANGELTGEIGLAPVRLQRITGTEPASRVPEGLWAVPDQGAFLEIRDGHVLQGIGPARLRLPLQPLGPGCWLFTRPDGPWPARILLRHSAPDRIELATARARSVIYQRLDIPTGQD